MNASISWQRYLKVQFQDRHRPFWACAAVNMAALISAPLTPYSFFLLILAIARVQYPHRRKEKDHDRKAKPLPPAPRQVWHSETRRTNFSFRIRFEFDVTGQFCKQYCQCQEGKRGMRSSRWTAASGAPVVELLPKMLWSQNPENFSLS